MTNVGVGSQTTSVMQATRTKFHWLNYVAAASLLIFGLVDCMLLVIGLDIPRNGIHNSFALAAIVISAYAAFAVSAYVLARQLPVASLGKPARSTLSPNARVFLKVAQIVAVGALVITTLSSLRLAFEVYLAFYPKLTSANLGLYSYNFFSLYVVILNCWLIYMLIKHLPTKAVVE